MINTLINITYIGEHIGLKHLGETFVYLALITSFLAFLGYIIFNINKKAIWKSSARYLYIAHVLSVIGASAILFIILNGRYYEFSYVWEHTASYLQLKFIISAFWAGQEGSFLLWVLLEGLLGIAVLISSRKNESYILPVVSIGQFMLTTMLLGTKIGSFILGKSPFILMREQEVNAGADFFKDPNYLQQIFDGNGINPLLENIWMVTHPPLLFLGYSAAIIPFAYAIMALWKGDFNSWLKPAFPWTLFSIITLGGGILLGGAWAYESLTFGGFWAWDPVENASLMPWLFILAGFHMMILNKKRQHSYALSFLFIILGYIFVVYASYLTRSGVLGSTSVHAFGNNGLSAQMVSIMAITFGFSIYLYLRNIRNFPGATKDRFMSREFWMYLGALVLVLSSFQIFATTSIPVFNKIFGSEIAPPAETVAFYNKWQLPFGMLVVFLIGGSLVLRYGKNDEKELNKRFWIVFISTILVFIVEFFVFNITGWAFLAFMFFITFALVSSLSVLFFNKWNNKFFANSFSHLGFSIFLLGVLVAFSNSQIISSNTSKYDLGDENSNRQNQVLVKGQAQQLGNYWVVYDSLRQDKNYLHYTVNFFREKNDKEPEFSIHPDINVNSRMGNVYNPSTYHSITKDVFTFITYANIDADIQGKKFDKSFEGDIKIGDTVKLKTANLIFRDLKLVGKKDSMDIKNIRIDASFDVYINGDSVSSISASYIINDGQKEFADAEVNDGEYLVRFNNISSTPNKISLMVIEKRLEYIVIKSTVFPWISFILIGGFIMFAGLFVSLWRHIKDIRD